MNVQSGFSPGNNPFVVNHFNDFEPSVADVVIDTGVPDTLILGQHGTVNA